MPCSHCGQIGHNIRTCPQRNINIIGNVLETETVPIQRTTEHVIMNKYRIVNLQNTNYLISGLLFFFLESNSFSKMTAFFRIAI